MEFGAVVVPEALLTGGTAKPPACMGPECGGDPVFPPMGKAGETGAAKGSWARGVPGFAAGVKDWKEDAPASKGGAGSGPELATGEGEA